MSRQYRNCVTLSGPPLWGGVVGLNEKYGICPGRLPGQGSTPAGRTATPPGEGRRMVLPLLVGGSKKAGVVRARTSVLRRQNTVAQFIATRPILGLWEAAERCRGTRVTQRQWEQSGIDWRLAREKVAAAAAQAGANEAASETPGSGSESESDPDPTPGGTTGGTGGGGVPGSQWIQ